MTANLQAGTVTVQLRTPSGDVPLGEFALASGQVQGTDQRGISYRGTCTSLLDGVNVELTVTVPAGTRLAGDLRTEAAAEHQLSFYLNQEHLAGTRVKPIRLPGIGSADVVFTIR
jgi:hypothetical protein